MIRKESFLEFLIKLNMSLSPDALLLVIKS